MSEKLELPSHYITLTKRQKNAKKFKKADAFLRQCTMAQAIKLRKLKFAKSVQK